MIANTRRARHIHSLDLAPADWHPAPHMPKRAKPDSKASGSTPAVPDPEMLVALTESLDEVRDEVVGLYRVVNEVREDLGWIARNHHRPNDWQVAQPITSMPLDPLAADWSARLNRFTAADLPSTQQDVEANGNGQASKGDAENVDKLRFCCEQPRLQWEGERENATIVCSSCGFVLADDGQLGDWHDPEQIVWERDFIEAERELEAAMTNTTPEAPGPPCDYFGNGIADDDTASPASHDAEPSPQPVGQAQRELF